MALDLSKLSDEMESALVGARLLAQDRNQALIQPEHLLLLLLEPETSSLRRVFEAKNISLPPLLDALSRRADQTSRQRLEEGRRPLASQTLRTLLDEAFALSDKRGKPAAEPVDVLAAAVGGTNNELRLEFRRVGLTPDDLPDLPQPSLGRRSDASATAGNSQDR